MKIISEGNIPSPSKKWWVGQKICCGFCTAEFLLEDDDEVAEVIEKNLDGGILAKFHCPVCSQILVHEKPIPRKENLWKHTKPSKNLINEPPKNSTPEWIADSSTSIDGGENRGNEVPSHPRLSVPILKPDLVHVVAKTPLAPQVQKIEPEKRSLKFSILPWKWF
ncbi:MAG: hypothetical protein HC845_09865 [Akkermansiaceae bacterium]|nr:hypothetical protein [Akkermansiaceae bacterium]